MSFIFDAYVNVYNLELSSKHQYSGWCHHAIPVSDRHVSVLYPNG